MDENAQYRKGTILSKLDSGSHKISIETPKYYFLETWRNMKVKMWKKS